MSIIFKAGILSRGAQVILQSHCCKRNVLVSLITRNTREVCKPLAQARFYSSTDNEPLLPDKERIYDGILRNKIRYVKIFSLMTSVGSILIQPYLISKALENNSILTTGLMVSVFGFFTIVTPLLLHLITRRYVIYVDYNPEKDNYIATVYTIFVQKKEIEFTPGDVHLPDISEILTTCTIKGKPMFIDMKLFSDINHYKRIMGFDKPMDFSVNTDDLKTRKD